jgi:hypothetical protein
MGYEPKATGSIDGGIWRNLAGGGGRHGSDDAGAQTVGDEVGILGTHAEQRVHGTLWQACGQEGGRWAEGAVRREEGRLGGGEG